MVRLVLSMPNRSHRASRLARWPGNLRRDSETEEDALEQVSRYLDALDVPEGWLVLFDLRSTAPWPQRLFNRTQTVSGRSVHLVGC